MSAREAIPLLLMYAVFPLLVATGFADWACHRATRIERTSGLRENLVHWLMFGQLGLGVLAVALLELNEAVIVCVALVFVGHEVTVWLELRFTTPRRQVRPIEQMVHSFMELLPLASLLLLVALRWEPITTGDWEFALRLKDGPWPWSAMAAAAALTLLFNVMPLAEETLRCCRAGGPAG